MATILVVDDMAVIREPVSMCLRGFGFETISAANGRDALRMLRQHRPDLMLLDLAMPELDGLGVLRAIHANKSIPRCPTIVLTAMADKKFVVHAARFGVKDYLLKSQFSLDYLVQRINKALEAAAEPPQLSHSKDTAANSISRHELSTKTIATGTAGEDQAGSSIDDATEKLKAIRPILNRSELNERLDSCGEMRALSPIVAEVIKLTSSDRASIDQIVKVIKRDHAIALKVLKLANSAVYARGETVESLEQAVSRIGTGSIRQTVLNMAVVDQFGPDKQFAGIDPLQFWEHSIACGLIGADIARSLNDKEPDLAFTMGLLHDVGRLVYIEQLGDLYKQVFDVAAQMQLPLERVESKLLLLNHADCMDRILHVWNFPKNLIDPIVFHHLSIGNMRRMASKRIVEVATLGLANRLAHAMLLGSSGNEVIYPTEGLCQHLKLSQHSIERIENTIREQTSEIKYTMLASATNLEWIDRREVWKKQLTVPFRPIYVSTEPTFDAYRMFCEQLEDRTVDPPNVLVLHITDARELGELSAQAKAAAEQEGATELPIVALSPKGDLRPPESLAAGRDCQTLPTPVSVARLVSTFNRALTSQPGLAKAA